MRTSYVTAVVVPSFVPAVLVATTAFGTPFGSVDGMHRIGTGSPGHQRA